MTKPLKSSKKFIAKQQLEAYCLLLPALLIILVFTIFPILNSIYLSLFEKKLSNAEGTFIGFKNYIKLFDDRIFIKVMSNSIFFAVVTVLGSMAIGLALAIFLSKKARGTGILRTSFFYPSVIPMVAVANIWLFIYTPKFGLLEKFTQFFFGVEGINWLGDPKIVMWALVAMFIWREAGYLMIFYIAGIQNVDKKLYEAALIDGANGWNRFWHITLPLIMPTVLFVFIIAVTNAFKLVDHLVIMTGGGPNNASNVLLYHIYETAFSFWDQGKAATLTVVLLVIMMSIAIFQMVFVDKEIHYE